MSEEKFSPEFIRKERELVERVTPLPWHAWESPSGRNYVMSTHEVFKVPDDTRPIASCLNCDGAMRDNADYIVTAANHYPAALEEIERLRTRAERAEAALESYAEFYDRAAGLCGLPDALPSSETDLIILTRLAEHDEIEVQRARAERAEADAERLAEVLRSFEWSYRSRLFGDVCPLCAKLPDEGHAADCSIGTALAAHEARKGGEG